jgi:hypothetical protein
VHAEESRLPGGLPSVTLKAQYCAVQRRVSPHWRHCSYQEQVTAQKACVSGKGWLSDSAHLSPWRNVGGGKVFVGSGKLIVDCIALLCFIREHPRAERWAIVNSSSRPLWPAGRALGPC